MKITIFQNGILSPKALAKIGQNWPKLKISVFFKGLSRIGTLYLQGNCPDLGFECKESRDAKNFASLKKVHLQWLPFHFTQISVNSSLVCVSTCKNVLNTLKTISPCFYYTAPIQLNKMHSEFGN